MTIRNDPPGMTPLQKLIAPPERTVQIVSVISNHEDVAGACPLFRPSSLPLSLFLSHSFCHFSYTKKSCSSLSLSLYFFKNVRVDQVSSNLFACKIFLRVVHQKCVLPRQITCNATARFLLMIFVRWFFYSCKPHLRICLN